MGKQTPIAEKVRKSTPKAVPKRLEGMANDSSSMDISSICTSMSQCDPIRIGQSATPERQTSKGRKTATKEAETLCQAILNNTYLVKEHTVDENNKKELNITFTLQPYLTPPLVLHSSKLSSVKKVKIVTRCLNPNIPAQNSKFINLLTFMLESTEWLARISFPFPINLQTNFEISQFSLFLFVK